MILVIFGRFCIYVLDICDPGRWIFIFEYQFCFNEKFRKPDFGPQTAITFVLITYRPWVRLIGNLIYDFTWFPNDFIWFLCDFKCHFIYLMYFLKKLKYLWSVLAAFGYLLIFLSQEYEYSYPKHQCCFNEKFGKPLVGP